MGITMKTIPTIISDLKKRKPSTLAKDSDKPLTTKEAVTQLAPTLLEKKEEGFTTAELVDVLATHNIIVKPHNLTRYLREHNAPPAKPQNVASGQQSVEPEPSSAKSADEGNNADKSSEGCHQ